MWEDALDADLLSCSFIEDWEQRPYHSHIVPIWTRSRHEQYLFFHLFLLGINAYNIFYSVVPKGLSRIRLIFHAHNTEQEFDKAVAIICSWAAKMLNIEEGILSFRVTLPKAAQQMYAMQAALI